MTTLTIQIVNPLFKLKMDTTEKTSCDPSGPGLEARSLIKLGGHIFKERTVVNKRELMAVHWQASAGACSYTLRLALHIQWVLNGACGQMENQGHSIIRLPL